MKAKIPADKLVDAGRRALQFRARSGDLLPAHKNAVFRVMEKGLMTLDISSPDGGARMAVPVTGHEPGVVSVGVDHLDKLVSVLPHHIDLNVASSDRLLSFRGPGVHMTLPLVAGDNFTSLQQPQSWWPVDDAEMQRVVKSVLWAASDDPYMPQWSSIHLGEDGSEATDTKVMARIGKAIVPPGSDVIVPAQAWVKLRAFIGGGDKNLKMSADPGSLWLRGSDWCVWVRLTASKYTGLKPFVYAPDASGQFLFAGQKKTRVHWVYVQRQEMLEICRRILGGSVSADEKKLGAAVRVMVDPDDDEMNLVSHYPSDIAGHGIHVEQVLNWQPGSVTKSDVSGLQFLNGVAFFSLYLTKALSALTADTVKVMWAEPVDGMQGMPMQIHDEKNSVAVVVMPRGVR
jgi:hypothetical protein